MRIKTNEITFSALIGIVAYMFTDIIHEVIGHSSAALIAGYDITLLTSVYFKSDPINFMIGLGGPISNLVFGLLIFFILMFKSIKSYPTALFLATVMAYNLFWFSGELLGAGFWDVKDWTYAVAQLDIGVFARPLLIIMGVLAYSVSIKLVVNRFSNLKFRFSEITLRQSAHYAFLFGALAAIIAGLFFAPDRLSASKEGLLEMVSSLPILFIIRSKYEKAIQITVKTNWDFYISVCIVYILFCVTFGKGIY